MKISVIIPCYQVEKYLDRCLQSVVDQTIGVDNLDIILIDDASQDETYKIMEKWQKQYNHSIRIFRQSHNSRQGSCRNLGIKKSTGEYISFIDADDWIEPDIYERMINIAETGQCDVVSCECSRDKEFKINFGSCVRNEEEKNDRIICINSDEDRSRMIACNLLKTYVVTKIYRRDFLIKNNITFAENMIYEDVYFMGLLHFFAEKIGMTEKKMYHYFVNEESVSLKKNTMAHRDIIKVNRLLFETLRKKEMSPLVRKAVEYDLLCSYYLTALKMIFIRFDEIPCDMFYEIQSDIRKMVPEYKDNPFIKEYTSPVNKILLETIDKELTKENIFTIGGMIQSLANAKKD